MDFTTTYVGLLFVQLFKSFAQYVVVDNRQVPMTTAFQKCRNISRGTLISVDQLHQFEKKIREQCGNNLHEEYWIGDYSIMTPFMYIAGCFLFKRLNGGPMMFNITGNSIAKCQARCLNEVGMAIMNDTCQCVRNEALLNSLNPVSAQLCDIRENEEVLGGRQSAMVVYIKSKRSFSSDKVNPNCYYGNCNGRGYKFLKCSDMNVANVVCGNSAVDNSNTSSWWKAMDKCISTYNSYPLTPDQFENNKSSLCLEDDNTLTWTNQREYRDRITISDPGIPENLIFNDNIVCQVLNVTDLKTRELGNQKCKSLGEASHGHLCFIDEGSNKRTNETICIVDLSTSSTTKSSSTTNNDLVIPDKDNPADRSSNGLPQGLIIGAAAGGVGAAVFIILIVAVCVLRHLRKKKEENAQPLASTQTKHVDVSVNAGGNDENYDILHQKQQNLLQNTDKKGVYAHMDIRGAQEAEYTYDSTSNIISSKRDSTYDTCAKGNGDESSPTYDHTVRGDIGKTSNLTEIIYDKNELNTYDTSETVIYDKSGSLIYDKSEPNIYDKSGIDINDKTGTRYDDKTGSSMYGMSDVYSKIGKVTSDAQKVIDPTYDHA